MSVDLATDGTAVVSEQQTVRLPSDQQQREDTTETTNLLNPDDKHEVLGLEPACQKAAWRDAKPFMVAWLAVSIVSGIANAGGIAGGISASGGETSAWIYSYLALFPGLVAALIGVTCFFCHVCNTGSQRPRILWARIAAGLDAIPVVGFTVITIFAAIDVYVSYPDPDDPNGSADDDEYLFASMDVDVCLLLFLPIICHCFMSLWVATSLRSVHRASFKI